MGMMQTESNYRREWSVLAGRAESDVYIPEALREPLQRGDRVRILVDGLQCAVVRAGDVLTVTSVRDGDFETEAPRLHTHGWAWSFCLSGEGTGWERVR